MNKKTNVYCRDCSERLTKDNHRTDHTGHIYPTCKKCCNETRRMMRAKQNYYFGVAL